MNLIDFGSILLRRGWIMILLAVIAAASAFFLSRLQTPIYRATQTVLIEPARADLGLTESATRLVRQYAVRLDSDFTAARVIDTLRLDMTPGEMNGATVVNSDALRLTIQIEVELPDAEIARQVAQEFGNQLVQYRFQENQQNRLEDRITASLQDVARVDLDRPRPPLNAAAGGVLGLILGGIIIFLMEYLESAIIRRRDDLERTLTLPVLASIPDFER
jgi:capsular polysaccharide biosynthesis protein